jgi:PPOX class probable F420-dependent enzyme
LIISAGVRAFVESQRVGRLATADERGRPHVVPICFALDGDTLYTPIDEKPKAGDYTRLRRLRSIAVNPHVQVLLDLYDDADWSCLRYVQLRGTARVIDDGAEHTRAIALLRARHEQYVAMKLDARPVIAVDVERVVEWSAARGGAAPTPLDSDIAEGSR